MKRAVSNIVIGFFCVSVLSGIALAEADADSSGILDIPLDELMEIPITVSASRSEQSIYESSVPVSILTAEDIHYSGLTSIPEILQFVAGVDVQRVDRTRYSVGVRGMMGQYSDRTLVLINGRTALNPIWGPPDWSLLPIHVEDIERIEVVRGPGGAVWGANAYTGVINIITKKIADINGNLISTTFNEFGDAYTHLRTAGAKDKWAWRISAGYEDFESSDAAGAGRKELALGALSPFINIASYPVRDFLKTWKFDSELQYHTEQDMQLILGAAYSDSVYGDRETLGYYPRRNCYSAYTRLFARIEKQYDNETSGYIQWFGNYLNNHWPHITAENKYYENDIEGQINFHPAEDHSVSVGGNLRWTHIHTQNDYLTNEFLFQEHVYDEYWAGFFAVDRWEMTERLTLESQGRVDHYSKSHADWSARCSALYALDEQKEHIFRLSAARAFRSPTLGLREPYSIGLMGMFNIVSPTKALDNEKTYSLEAGYAGKIADRWHLRIDTYYQRMEDILGGRVTYMGPIAYTSFYNLDGADSHGAECELTYTHRKLNFSAWYAYNELNTDRNEEIARAYFPARHKSGLRMRYQLDDKWTLNTNYCYNDNVNINASGSPYAGPDAFHRFDLVLARKIAGGKGELAVGVTDLFNQTRDPMYSLATFTSFETPGRTFFARVQWTF